MSAKERFAKFMSNEWIKYLGNTMPREQLDGYIQELSKPFIAQFLFEELDKLNPPTNLSNTHKAP